MDDVTSRRLHPRLRCLRNGAAPVNALRSDISSTVATSTTLSAEALGLPANLDLRRVRESMTMRPAGIVADKKERFPKRKKLAGQPAAESSFVNVFVELFSETADDGEAT